MTAARFKPSPRSATARPVRHQFANLHRQHIAPAPELPGGMHRRAPASGGLPHGRLGDSFGGTLYWWHSCAALCPGGLPFDRVHLARGDDKEAVASLGLNSPIRLPKPLFPEPYQHLHTTGAIERSCVLVQPQFHSPNLPHPLDFSRGFGVDVGPDPPPQMLCREANSGRHFLDRRIGLECL